MANPDHVALVRQGSEAIDRYLSEHPGEQLDLTGADLSGLDLSGCNIPEANLAGANLAGTNLSAANLQRVSLAVTNLQDASLNGADCRGTGFHRARMQGADLRGVQMDEIGVGSQLMCASANTFENVRWEREQLEEILALMNLNRDWEIRFEIVPRS